MSSGSYKLLHMQKIKPKTKSTLSFVSLFSGGGLGGFGLKKAGFDCVATSELLPRRLDVQKANNMGDRDESYVLGDITKAEVKARLLEEVESWRKRASDPDLTLLIASPPCQGMSVANHKKGDETLRNSLVVNSLMIIKELMPKFFVLENVRSFLGTTCFDHDGVLKTIDEAVTCNLAGDYQIESRILNFKDYGGSSSRTRTLVIGARRDLIDILPGSIFPARKKSKTLMELIGRLPNLYEMGSISEDDIFHNFRKYDPRMRPWISIVEEGKSAFQNVNPKHRPHRLIDGVIVENIAGNGDKYKRNNWNKVAPCVHTRNDILASQNTVHPIDDRVFSIRELSLMMGVPKEFKWSHFSLAELNSLPLDEKREFLREHELNIRQCLGEGIPVEITNSIGLLIDKALKGESLMGLAAQQVSHLALQNPRKAELAAYPTRLDIAHQVISNAPNYKTTKVLRILEPSVGGGAFLLPLLEKYRDHKIELDLVDIDPLALDASKVLLESFSSHSALRVRYFNIDFLQFQPDTEYDLVIGNPPFGKSQPSAGSFLWQSQFGCKDLYSKFLEKSLETGYAVSFVIPKTFLSSPESANLRNWISGFQVKSIDDFGEKAFKDIKIETIGLSVSKAPSRDEDLIKILSYPLKNYRKVKQSYVCNDSFPSWLLYRSQFFDWVASNLEFGQFKVIRDRFLSSKHYKTQGDYQVFRSGDFPRNGKDKKPAVFISKDQLPTSYRLYKDEDFVLVAPNLSYYPRAVRLRKGLVADGSAAVLLPRTEVEESCTKFFSSEIFFYFYRIARNFSTRSLNLDASSVYFWGIPKKGAKFYFDASFLATSSELFTWIQDEMEILHVRGENPEALRQSHSS